MTAHLDKPVERSKISVVTPSLNHGRFLRDTIESLRAQTYGNVEHVVVDGGSTDETVGILREYPAVKWISEKETGDNAILDAIWKAFHMSTGDYIVFLCVSDGIADRNWFRRGVDVLDRDPEVSHVWGLSQNQLESGEPGKLWWPEFLERHPPQKRDFLPYWLATRHGVESNAIFRRAVFESCHPRNTVDEPYRFHPTHGFNYNLNSRGHLPYFLPVISYLGRVHGGQRQEKYRKMLDDGNRRYNRDIETYRRNLLSGRVRHCFRDGESRVIGEVAPDDLRDYRRTIMRLRVKRSLQRKFQRILDRI